MDYLNRVELCGRLTKELDLRYTARGTAVANVSIATNRWAPAPDGERERKEYTEFHSLVLWSGLATQVTELRKGDWFHVKGRIQSRSWEGQDRQKRRVNEIIVEEIVPTNPRAAAPALDEEEAVR